MSFLYKVKNIEKILIITILMVASTNIFVVKTYAAEINPKLSIEYLKDTEGNLTLEQVKSGEFNSNFKTLKGSTVSIGYSKDTWWYRIKVKDLYDFNEKRYFSINNADVEKIKLYVPQTIEGQETYYIMRAGWGVKNKNDDIGFIYPVFEIPKNIDFDRYVYIQIKSVYTHNYEFKIISEEQFNELRQVRLLCIGVLFGTLIAMLLYNFMLFMFLKDRIYLHYVTYMFIMIIYQLGLTGAMSIFKWKPAYLIEQYFGLIGLFLIISIIIFIRVFLETDKNTPFHDKLLKISLGINMVDIFMMLIGYKYIAIVTSAGMIIVNLILILSASIFCLYRGLRQARYFLLAWSIMLTGFMIFGLRGWGVIPHNFFTMNVLLISASIESILISVALADRIRIMRQEKEKALILFEDAKEMSKNNEIAFLQAQIKPHFLFNALNTVISISRYDIDKSRNLLIDFSNYLRGSFDFKDSSQFVSLKKEIDLAKAYLEIEKARFEDRIQVSFYATEDFEAKVPRIMLQPIIENAIIHGILPKLEGGEVNISIKKEGTMLIFIVEDNGVGMDEKKLNKIFKEENESGIGIYNIEKRLQALYGKGLEIKSNLDEGTQVKWSIPLGNERD